MATIITTGTVINNASVPAIDLTGGGTVTIEAGAYALSGDVFGAANLRGNGNYIVDVEGTLAGYGGFTTGLYFSGIGQHTVTVGLGGTIAGKFGGIYAEGGSLITSLTNNGLISTNTASAAAIDNNAAGDSFFTNIGTISSAVSDGIFFGDPSGGTTVSTHDIDNQGVIHATAAGKFAIESNGSVAVERLTNEGLILGNISLGGGADILSNAGTITGTVSMGDGVDFVETFGAISGLVDLGAGNDQFHGSKFADTVTGGADDDTIDGGAGTDTMTGGTGNDTFIVDSQLDTTNEIAGGGTNDHVKASVSYILGAAVNNDIEVLETTNAAGTAAINLTGNTLAQTITGNAGNNILNGGADVAVDALIGGAGNDTYVLGASINDTVTDTAGIDTITSAIDRSLAGFAAIENLTLLAGIAISGTGNALANVITGNANGNILNGGIDALTDTLIGGLGDDTYIINSATDNITEVVNGGFGDRARASLSFALAVGDNIEFLETTNAALTTAINLTGNEFGQTVTGNNGINTLRGLGGGDTLDGGADAVADILVGGLGDDTYIIRSSSDDVQELAGQGFDFVTTAVSFVLGATDDIEELNTIDVIAKTAINLTGNGVAQTIHGNRGNNVISGLGGADSINGDWGADTMTGGTGSDTFFFADNHSGQTATTMDVITDFTKGAVGVGDRITYFNPLIIGGSSAAATANVAKIGANGVVTFAAGSGTTLADALHDVSASCSVGGEASGEMALFRVNGSGFFDLFISDGVAGVTTGDVVIQLGTVSSISSISIANGLTILV
jgi:trimeric autotransporter adhesin